LADLDPPTRSFVYASAGQEGYLLKADGGVTKLESTGLPLGILRDEVIDLSSPISLAANDIVLLITDGVHESKSVDGSPFGIDQVLEFVRAHQALRAREIVDAVCQTVLSHARHAPQGDDVTVMVIKSIRHEIRPTRMRRSNAAITWEGNGAEKRPLTRQRLTHEMFQPNLAD